MGIEIKNISKQFDNKIIFDNYSASIADCSFNIIMGASGCGKTTLLRMILGLELSDSGRIMSSYSKPAVVFQENRLCDGFSALENVNITFSSASPVSKQLLVDFGLEDVMDKPVFELSGGMKRRVALARALAADSDLIILDEPFKGLDDITKATVIDSVIRYCSQKTVIMVSHDISEIEYIAGKLDITRFDI